jgi:hypothetical protein
MLNNKRKKTGCFRSVKPMKNFNLLFKFYLCYVIALILEIEVYF